MAPHPYSIPRTIATRSCNASLPSAAARCDTRTRSAITSLEVAVLEEYRADPARNTSRPNRLPCSSVLRRPFFGSRAADDSLAPGIQCKSCKTIPAAFVRRSAYCYNALAASKATASLIFSAASEACATPPGLSYYATYLLELLSRTVDEKIKQIQQENWSRRRFP